MAMLRCLMLFFIVFSMGNAEDAVEKAAKKCPGGWTNFGRRCYKHFFQSVNWITAERNCQNLGANLASVRNKLENDFLLSLLPSSSTRSWVGAHDGVQEGQWMWSDGTVFFYNNWCSEEPNNLRSSENCLEISFSPDQCWNDKACSSQMSFFCVTE